MQIEKCFVITYTHLDMEQKLRWWNWYTYFQWNSIHFGNKFLFHFVYDNNIYPWHFHVRPKIISIVTNITNENAETMSHNTIKKDIVNTSRLLTLGCVAKMLQTFQISTFQKQKMNGMNIHEKKSELQEFICTYIVWDSMLQNHWIFNFH